MFCKYVFFLVVFSCVWYGCAIVCACGSRGYGSNWKTNSFVAKVSQWLGFVAAFRRAAQKAGSSSCDDYPQDFCDSGTVRIHFAMFGFICLGQWDNETTESCFGRSYTNGGRDRGQVPQSKATGLHRLAPLSLLRMVAVLGARKAWWGREAIGAPVRTCR